MNQPIALANQSEDSPTMDAEQIQDWLSHKLAEILDLELDEVDIDQDFLDYGLSSLEATNISGELETFLGCRLPPTLLWDFPTISEIAAYLGENLDTFRATAHDEDSPIPEEYYQLELFPEYQRLQEQKAQIVAMGVGNPFFIQQEKVVNDKTTISGQELINFASYNYIGMSGDPVVSAKAKAAIDRYGTSVCASRLVSGERPIHQQLERAIAELIGVEDSIVFVGGHATNVGTISHLFKPNDVIFYDALSHNSITEGCKASGATLIPFPHNDFQALERLLNNHRSHYQKALIVIEGVYSADGDIAPLPEFLALKHQYKTWLMVDEAHSIGVLGDHGRGIAELFNIDPNEVELWMGTLSKSFASCGGYIAGSKALVDYLKYTAPSFVFSVGMAPPNAASALAAIEVLHQEPERVSKVKANAKLFLDLAAEHGINTGDSKGSSVVPVIVGDSLKTIRLSQILFKRGINAPFMIYPSVPHHLARLRFFITSCHSEEQIKTTVATIAEELAALD